MLPSLIRSGSRASSLSRNLLQRTAGPSVGAVRDLNVHEHVSMELMNSFNIRTPESYVATSPEEAEDIFAKMQSGGKFIEKKIFFKSLMILVKIIKRRLYMRCDRKARKYEYSKIK